MLVTELYDHIIFEDIFAYALKNFEVSEDDRSTYMEFFMKLKNANNKEFNKEKKQLTLVSLTNINRFHEPMIITNNSRKIISFLPLEEIAGLELSNDTTDKHSLLFIAASIIDNLSFYGSDDMRIELGREMNNQELYN